MTKLQLLHSHVIYHWKRNFMLNKKLKKMFKINRKKAIDEFSDGTLPKIMKYKYKFPIKLKEILLLKTEFQNLVGTLQR